VLALGGELKDTLSVYKNGYVVTSQFLGDLDEYRNFGYFEETLSHLCRLFDVKPDVVVTDLHPDFRTTRFAAGMGIPHLRVQHHYAHVLAPMLEHGVETGRKVLGIAWDGYGYGEDGKAWGGEFFYADYLAHVRAGHFKEVALPGGNLAARQPWRMALSYLRESYGSDLPSLPGLDVLPKNKTAAVLEMIDKGVHSPLTSSCGRLFDAVAFLCGLAPVEMEFEAEAAMRLEAAATAATAKSYNFSLEETGPAVRISFEEAIREIIKDLKAGTPIPFVAAKFHNTLARLIVRMAGKARKDMGISTVVLVGGVFLNRTLLVAATRLLKRRGFEVLRPVFYSPSDESLSLGQVAHALAILRRPKS
jgi:hydrogenase maturation protein HypF